MMKYSQRKIIFYEFLMNNFYNYKIVNRLDIWSIS